MKRLAILATALALTACAATQQSDAVVAAIMGIHALGGLDYHPSAAEADMIRDKVRQ